MTARSASDEPRSSRPAQDDAPELAAYCARPSCRREYRRASQPGRPQTYCSEVCRRTAEKELRTLRSRLSHFESVVEQARIDLAAHGRMEEGANVLSDLNAIAASAVSRAAGVLRFTSGSDDPIADELRLLHDAVAPLVASHPQAD